MTFITVDDNKSGSTHGKLLGVWKFVQTFQDEAGE